MRKVFIIVLLTFMCQNLFSQIYVKDGSFHELEGFLMVDKNDHYDDNDRPMALIKISTENISAEERTRFEFKGNLETYFDPQFMTGEIYLYISTAATFIEIIHPDYGKTEYTLPVDLKPFSGYEMVVVSSFTVNDKSKPKVNYLMISADKSNAMIFIDDEFVGTGEVSKLLGVGETHTWRIECDMYHSEKGKVTIPQGEPLIVEKKLRPSYGFVYVNTYPEDDAKVYIDNKYVGKTPILSGKLMLGDHKMIIAKDLYKSAVKEFSIAENDTLDISINMVSDVAYVDVITDSLSTIYIDNDKKGVGNWKGKLSSGKHLFESRKLNHASAYVDADVKLGDTDTIIIPAPEPIYGHLDVSSSPQGADIYVDDVYCGTTPRIIEDLFIGEHKIDFEKDGYALSSRKIVVMENETVSLNEVLRQGKVIKIETDNVGDKIFVDRQYVGKSPVSISLTYGSHNIMVERDGYTTEESFYVQQSGKSSVKLFFGKEITIETDHKGDEVFVDGVNVGRSPCIVKLSFGKHNLKLRRGDMTLDKTFVIEKNDNKDKIKYVMGKNVTVSTSNKGDEVYIDNKYAGKTPLVKYMSFGNHKISVKRGDLEAAQNIEVKENGGQNEYTLYYGQLVKFDSDKEGDAVIVDGKRMGRTPLELDLSVGSHVVKVKRHRKNEVKNLYISKGGNSNYTFYPTKETITQFNDNGVRFFGVSASSEFGKNSYGIDFGSFRKVGWYMSLMTNFDVTDSIPFTGITQFLPDYQDGAYGVDYMELTDDAFNSRLSAMIGMMFRIKGLVYMKLGAGYGIYSSYVRTYDGKWLRSYDDEFSDVLLTAGLQFNIKHLILTTDVITSKDLKTIELKVGLGFGWRKKK